MKEKVTICRKCLISKTDQTSFFKKLETYIYGIPEENKVDQKVYEKRLNICRKCEYLSERMCRLCGCYVELRAVQKHRTCPDLPQRWK